MKSFLKKLTAVCTAVIIFLLMHGTYAKANDLYSDAWDARHVNIQGAPSNLGYSDYLVVASYGWLKATCNYNTHTNASATKGVTTITCETFAMNSQSITNLGSVYLYPSIIGAKVPVNARFKVTAHTGYINDTFTSKGTVTTKGSIY